MNSKTDAEFFKDLEVLIQKYKHVGLIHLIGLLDFAKMALLHEGDKVITKLENERKGGINGR